MKPPKKVVLAYSGGLDTSVIMRWLIETYRCKVIAFCADVGQGEDLDAVAEKARKTGAFKTVVSDLKSIFVRDYLFPMLRANAVYEGAYLLGTAIARPLIAKAQVALAQKEGADAVAHGATGKGNDQIRFELAYLALDSTLHILAPWRIDAFLERFHGRSELIAYAHLHGIPTTATLEHPYSIDRNLFHTSYEGGMLEDPWVEPPASMYMTTSAQESAPETPAYLEMGFVKGNPVSINGKRYGAAALLARLNRIGGAHGIGRIDLVENRYIGIKSRGVYETPGGTLLHLAHRAVESITLDREVLHLRDSLISQYATLIYNGYWFSPERMGLQRLFDTVQEPVTGTARLKLYKGHATVVGRMAPRSLYRREIATFEHDINDLPRQAEGFIRLHALRLMSPHETDQANRRVARSRVRV